MRVSPLSLGSRLLFPLLMSALLVGNLIEFQIQQDAEPNYYRPLRLRASSLLSSADAPLGFIAYYRLQELLGGSELLVPDDPVFREWTWGNLALVDVYPIGSRVIKPARAQELRRLTRHRIDFATVQGGLPTMLALRFLVDPDQVRGSRGILLPVSRVGGAVPRRELFLVSEAALSEFEAFLK